MNQVDRAARRRQARAQPKLFSLAPPTPTNMKVLVHVKEKCIPVSVGDGGQPVRWLANVGIARHDDHQGLTLGVPVGVKAEDGSLLNMDSTLVAAEITDMQHVWVTFKGAALPSEFSAP